MGKNESTRLELLYPAIHGPCTLGADVDRAPLPEPLLACYHHFFNALFVTAYQLDIPVKVHVPSHKGQVEHLGLGYPFEMPEEVESQQNVKL